MTTPWLMTKHKVKQLFNQLFSSFYYIFLCLPSSELLKGWGFKKRTRSLIFLTFLQLCTPKKGKLLQPSTTAHESLTLLISPCLRRRTSNTEEKPKRKLLCSCSSSVSLVTTLRKKSSKCVENYSFFKILFKLPFLSAILQHITSNNFSFVGLCSIIPVMVTGLPTRSVTSRACGKVKVLLDMVKD